MTGQSTASATAGVQGRGADDSLASGAPSFDTPRIPAGARSAGRAPGAPPTARCAHCREWRYLSDLIEVVNVRTSESRFVCRPSRTPRFCFTKVGPAHTYRIALADRGDTQLR